MENITRLDVQIDSFKYPGGAEVLSGIDFKVSKGEFIGVLGANGSGKTTLLKAVDGLIKNIQGIIRLDGDDIRKLSSKEIYSKVGLVFQNPDDQLFAPTVFEDVMFGPLNMGFSEKETAGRVNAALENVGMEEFAAKPIHNLSFGQKKRVCIAGLLAMGHQILLLDEPTASLDPMGVSSIMRLLKGLNREKGVTTVMATHSVDLIPLFIDRMLILDDGKIIKEGPPDNVFSDPKTVRQANLRMPRIGHLFEILKHRDGLDIDKIPLTIGQARYEMKKLLNASLSLRDF